MVGRKSRTQAASFKTSKIKTHKEEVKMYQAAEGKVHPERKKIKTAVHTIFELLHRVEASAKVGVVFYPQYLKLKGSN